MTLEPVLMVYKPLVNTIVLTWLLRKTEKFSLVEHLTLKGRIITPIKIHGYELEKISLIPRH